MEKIKNFQEKVGNLLGFDQQQLDTAEILKRAEEYCLQDDPSKAVFILVSRTNTDDWNEHICEALRKIFNTHFDQESANEIRWANSEEIVFSHLQQADLTALYDVAVNLFAVRPLSDTTALAILTYGGFSKYESLPNFFVGILDFYRTHENYETMIFSCFNRLWNDYDAANKYQILELLALFLAKEQKIDALLCLYWLYAYLEDVTLREILFSILINAGVKEKAFAISFLLEKTWPDRTIEQITERYNKIEERALKSGISTAVLFYFRLKSIQSVILFCLYAKAMGNIPLELGLIIQAHKRRPSTPDLLIKRIEEVAGRKLSVLTKKSITAGEDVFAETLDRLELVAKECVNGSEITERVISNCKDYYCFKPEAHYGLMALLKIYEKTGDKECLEMFKRSVSRIVPNKIEPMIYESIKDSAIGLKIISNRAASLDYEISSAEIFLNVLNKKVNKMTMDSSTKDIHAALALLDFYEKFSNKYDRNLRAAKNIRERIENLKFFSPYVLDEKYSNHMIIKKVEHLLFNNQYESILNLFKTTEGLTDAKLIELVLQAALFVGRGEQVIMFYNLLTAVDQNRSTLYSIEAAPFISIANMKTKKPAIIPGRFVSSVWDNVLLENPVNKMAYNVAGGKKVRH